MARSYYGSRPGIKTAWRKKSLKKAVKKAKSAAWRKPKKSQVSGGGMTANVLSNQAFTLTASPAPFPNKLTKVLTYRGTPYYASGAATTGLASLVVNSAYDPDYHDYFGNAQPLYFDQLCSANGPYISYIVKRWTVTWQLINGSAYELECIVDQTTQFAESDTYDEIRNRPTIMRQLLAASGSEGSRCEIVCSGATDMFRSDKNDEAQMSGTSTSSPADIIVQTLFWKNVRGTATYNLILVPTLMMEIQFFNPDAVAS